MRIRWAAVVPVGLSTGILITGLWSESQRQTIPETLCRCPGGRQPGQWNGYDFPMSNIEDFRRCGFMADASTFAEKQKKNFADSSEQDFASIGILIMLFGEWPPWFPWYLETATRNRHIDFHIVHDSDASNVVERLVLAGMPSNVWFHYEAFESLRARAIDAGLVDVPSELYKASCNLRPYYGSLYQHILAPYRFWGWGDHDVIYGRLDRFYNIETLEKFDAVGTGCCNRTNGPLSFFRMTEDIINMAKTKRYRINISKRNSDERFQYAFDKSRFSGNDTQCHSFSFQLRAGAVFSDGKEYSHFHFGGGSRREAMQKKVNMTTKLVRACPVDGDDATCGACFPSDFSE
eukprot:TRINITY_DN63428_c0_g1_i1.p1 TRINITY_DN63428_c0_g1~~TRINITY_DN63428_c0_g1_i1.p1  ORF type:complete len:348 (+),score=36.03 TRINITY_DN63428_c0_g1_i1:81-1124(+)